MFFCYKSWFLLESIISALCLFPATEKSLLAHVEGFQSQRAKAGLRQSYGIADRAVNRPGRQKSGSRKIVNPIIRL